MTALPLAGCTGGATPLNNSAAMAEAVDAREAIASAAAPPTARPAKDPAVCLDPPRWGSMDPAAHRGCPPALAAEPRGR